MPPFGCPQPECESRWLELTRIGAFDRSLQVRPVRDRINLTSSSRALPACGKRSRLFHNPNIEHRRRVSPKFELIFGRFPAARVSIGQFFPIYEISGLLEKESLTGRRWPANGQSLGIQHDGIDLKCTSPSRFKQLPLAFVQSQRSFADPNEK